MKVRLLRWLRSLRMGWFDFDGFCIMNIFLLGMLEFCVVMVKQVRKEKSSGW